MSNRKMAFTILLVLLVQVSVPMIPVDAASGRAVPSFTVDLTLSVGGSIEAAGTTTVAPGDHVAKVVVSNIGLSDAEVTVTLAHIASVASTEVQFISIDAGTVLAGTSDTILIDWAATEGAGQTLFARIVATDVSVPADITNEESQLDFDVSKYHEGVVLGYDIPAPLVGFADVRLNHDVHTFESTIRNDGVMAINAEMKFLFTNNADPLDTLSVSSGSVILQPGSLATSAVDDSLAISFDATSMLGTWELSSSVEFTGAGYTYESTPVLTTIVFSDYIISISAPVDRSTEPGATTSLSWYITNLGSDDDLTISLSSDLGWHDDTQEAVIFTLLDGESTTISVPVTVPIDAANPTLENVHLDLTSVSTDPYTVRSTGHVMVGDTYEASVTAQDAGPVPVTPGSTKSILFKITNSGTGTSAFSIDAGLTAPAEGWVVSPSAHTTPILAFGADFTISVQVTPTPISYPLKLNERNGAGDTLSAWLSATPISGGLPAHDTTPLIVETIITVDPGLETEQIILDPQEILDAKGAGGINEVLSLSVEVRHNLGNSIIEDVGAELTFSTPVFNGTNLAGTDEAVRWGVSITPSSVSNLQIDQIFQSWLLIDGPSSELPLAGELVIIVTAEPILTAAQIAGGWNASSGTNRISVIIPSITDGILNSEGEPKCDAGICDADVGNLTNFTISLENTGNDLTSYRLVIEDGLPDLWSATLVTSDLLNPSSIIDNLTPAIVQSGQPLGNDHITDFTLKVTTDPQADAETLQELTIRVENRDTGDILSSFTLEIRVEESVDFELHPTNHTIDLSPYETPLTRVFINNTGNVATTYTVWLDDSLQNDVNFVVESPTEVIVGAGYNDSIKIRLTPDSEASADELHMATLWVATANGMNLSAVIVANITADHHLDINVQDSISVTPGVNEIIEITFANTGNLEETLDIIAVIEGNWSSSWSQDQITLPIDSTLDVDLTIVVPALGGEHTLSNGDTHDVTISLYQAGNGNFLSSRSITLVVAPIFLVQVDNWPAEELFHKWYEATWDVTVTNIGNKDVTVNLDFNIYKPGLVEEGTISLAWEVDASAPETLVLPMGESVELTFKVAGKESEPDIYLEGVLQLKMTPNDLEVTGSTIQETELRMSRLFPYQDYPLQPSDNDEDLTQSMYAWSHIPEGLDTGQGVTYQIELCDAQRRLNLTQLGLSEDEFGWVFGLDVNGDMEPFDLNNDCSDGTHSLTTLPPRSSSELYSSNPLEMVINTPDRPNILTNDGYDLTFRLYHPDENNDFTVYTEATFSFFFSAKALPGIDDLKFPDGTLQEGQTSTITATLSNGGTSIALAVSAELICDGVSVADPLKEQYLLPAGEIIPLTWEIESDHLDWWMQTSDVDCEVVLNSKSWDGTAIDAKTYKLSGQVNSWSPNVEISFIATLVLIGASIGLLRLVGQNDKFRLAAIYSGVLALGFAFHLQEMVWWGPGILAITALWVWTMTWKSSVEFQLIHEDYQRARKGISTLYSDHTSALSDAKRQLSIVLSMPVLGMIAVILGVPPQINPNSSNMLSLVGYLVLVIGGVIFIIWNSNRMYGTLYGRLTEVEIQASRIERDLGDPARLLTELASDGLDLSAIISPPRPNVAAAGEASPSDVSDWDQEIGILTDDPDLETEVEVESQDNLVGLNIDDLFEDESSDVDESEVKADD